MLPTSSDAVRPTWKSPNSRWPAAAEATRGIAWTRSVPTNSEERSIGYSTSSSTIIREPEPTDVIPTTSPPTTPITTVGSGRSWNALTALGVPSAALRACSRALAAIEEAASNNATPRTCLMRPWTTAPAPNWRNTSTGVMSAPPPIPVRPTVKPTNNPAAATYGSTCKRYLPPASSVGPHQLDRNTREDRPSAGSCIGRTRPARPGLRRARGVVVRWSILLAELARRPPDQLLEHVSAAVHARVPGPRAAAGGPHRGQVVTGHAAGGGEVAARYRAAPSAETSMVRTVARFPAPL